MTDEPTTSDPEDWILYEKDPATKIATLTLNRPDQLNAPTIGMRLRYADLLHQANIDDDVKVLVIRGEGDDFGTGQDLPEFMEAVRSEDGLLREVGLEDADVTYPPLRNFRHGATATQWFTDPRGGCRTLQEFKKISIVEAKGYVLRLALLPSRRRRPRDRVRRRAVRPRRLPLRRRRAPDVVVGAVDGPPQVPGDGLHRPALHRRRDGRVRLREQRRAPRPARGRGAEVRPGLRPEPARPT